MRSGLLLIAAFVLGIPSPAFASAKSCPGARAVGHLAILVVGPKSGHAIPIEKINLIERGDRLEYQPAPDAVKDGKKSKAQIALVVVPSADSEKQGLAVLPVKPAWQKAEWKAPYRVAAVGVVLGPQGLSEKKVSAFVRKNPDLMPQLADYADRTSKIAALITTISKYEQSAPGTANLQSALSSFSSQYGVKLPALSTGSSTTAQASAMLHALLPAVSSSQPLDSSTSLVKGSAGLAASMASMFFGSPVGLATGGAALFENLRESLFPRTDFRAAFAQPAGAEDVTVCSGKAAAKPDTKLAYLWVQRVPNAAAPSVSLVQSERLPLAVRSIVTVTTASVAQLPLVARARDWRLVSGKKSYTVPVHVAVESKDDLVSLDLSKLAIPAGEYRLEADWDWTPLPVGGTLDLLAIPNLSAAALSPGSPDRLVQGSGVVPVSVTGADFEFVDWVGLENKGDPTASPTELAFRMDGVPGKTTSLRLEVDCDIFKAGNYSLELRQRNGAAQNVPVVIHPPNPQLAGLPLRVNFGSPQQKVILQGSGLGRIERITSAKATWTLAPPAATQNDDSGRGATIHLESGARVGDQIAARVFVSGIAKPIRVPNVLEVIGPLPEIVHVRKSLGQAPDVALFPGEIPSGSAVSFLLSVEHAGSAPMLHLSCGQSGDPSLELAPGARKESAEFDAAGSGSFYLSLDPGRIGPSGCALTATIENQATGTSAPATLGRIVLLPQIDRFVLTDRKAPDGSYVGELTGRYLQQIAQTGWSADRGFAVLGIPTPVAGHPGEQTLEIAMPWPPPAPQAPLYIWLQGETRGRRTTAGY